MDLPILAAIIGVGGTLLGTIVGWCLMMVTNFLVQKRRDEAKFRIGCRLIIGELEDGESTLVTSLKNKSWWSLLAL